MGGWHVLSPIGSRTAFDTVLTKYLHYRTVHVIDDRFPAETRCKPRRTIFQGTPPPSLLLRSLPAQTQSIIRPPQGLELLDVSLASVLLRRLANDRDIVRGSSILLALTLPSQSILPLLAADDLQPALFLLLTRRLLERGRSGSTVVRVIPPRTTAAAIVVSPCRRVAHVLIGVGDLDLGVHIACAGAVDLGEPGKEDVLGLDKRQLRVVSLAGAEDVGAVVRGYDGPLVSVGPGDEGVGRLVTGDVEAGFLLRFKSAGLASAQTRKESNGR